MWALEVRAVNFPVQFIEKDLHEPVALLGKFFARRSENLIPDPGHLDLEFPVCRIFSGVGPGIIVIDLCVMQFCPDLPGKEECPSDAHGTDRVKLVGIKEDLRLQALRFFPAAKPVRSDAVLYCFNLFRSKSQLFEYWPGHFRTFQGMTNIASTFSLVSATYIMQQ